MLNVSRLLGAQALSEKTGADAWCSVSRPVVVWNLTRACTLRCAHCYNGSGHGLSGELTTGEGLRVLDDLAAFRVPAVIFSGGEPLLRKDIFRLISYCAAKGMRAVLSTGGVDITRQTAKKIKDSGAAYAGVSLEGGEKINDSIRGVQGAFKRALDGIRHLRDAGVATGVRFTMSRKNIGELDFIFGLIEKEGIARGYFSHMVYSGRGEGFASEPLDSIETRRAVDIILQRAADFLKRGLEKDIVTGNNDADGAYLYLKLKASDPQKAGLVHRLLLERGGNSSGVAIGNIDYSGDIRPDQFWSGDSLGNVRRTDFSRVWTGKDPLLEALRDKKRLIKGRCSRCAHLDICAGGCRVRAGFVTGDIWAQDPACYLTDEELGISIGEGRT